MLWLNAIATASVLIGADQVSSPVGFPAPPLAPDRRVNGRRGWTRPPQRLCSRTWIGRGERSWPAPPCSRGYRGSPQHGAAAFARRRWWPPHRAGQRP